MKLLRGYEAEGKDLRLLSDEDAFILVVITKILMYFVVCVFWVIVVFIFCFFCVLEEVSVVVKRVNCSCCSCN